MALSDHTLDLLPYILKGLLVLVGIIVFTLVPWILMVIFALQNREKLWAWLNQPEYFQIPKTEDEVVLDTYKAQLKEQQKKMM